MKTLTQQQTTRLKRMLTAAQQAKNSGLHSQAMALYRDILKDAPDAHDVRHQLAILLARSGKPEEAVNHFRLILKSNPTHALTHVNLGNALFDIGMLPDAAVELRHAIALDAKLVSAHFVLGLVLRRMKQTQESITYLKQTLDLDRRHHAAFNALALAYRDIDDLPRALECLEHAVGLAPQSAEYRANFAVTLKQAELNQWAVDQFLEALKLKPDWIDVIVLLGETLQDMRRFDDAKECFDRALTLKPNEPELLERRGFTYLEMGDTEHALAEFDSVLADQPNRPMGLLGLGRSHLEAGYSNDAASALEKLIALNPERPTGYFYLASVRKFKPDDELIPRLESLIERSKEDRDTSMALNFALGKIYDDCKLWDKSFAHYARGNELRNQEYQYDPKVEEAKFDALISVFDHAFFEKHRECSNEQSELPILIVGMPRSGTTLTEQIISSHPQVIGAGEVMFWGKAPKAIPYTMRSSISYPECLDGLSQEHAHKIAGKYIDFLQQIAGPGTNPVRITDKMPHNFVQLGLITLIFPRARIVHCRRNAMDNCLSIYFQNFGGNHPYAYDLTNLGHHYKQYERLMAHWQSVLPTQILDINYEETIADPEYWSRKLIEHVGLEWDDACLAPHKLERTVKTASHWQVRQPIYKTSVQRWKNYEKHLGPLQDALGYKG